MGEGVIQADLCPPGREFVDCGGPCYRLCITPPFCILPCDPGCKCREGLREHPITKRCVPEK